MAMSYETSLYKHSEHRFDFGFLVIWILIRPNANGADIGLEWNAMIVCPWWW